MKPKTRLYTVILMAGPLLAGPLLSGCATGGRTVENVAFRTHQHVLNLEKNLQGSVQQLNETAAGLLARVDANDQALRAVAGRLEENQAKLDTLEQRVDALIRTYYQQQQQRTALPAPGSASGQSEVEISNQGFVVEESGGAVRR